MAYMRNGYYLWNGENKGEEWLHIWAWDGYDGWDLSQWACEEDDGGEVKRRAGYEEASGTSLPVRIMDHYVLMRLAELIYKGQIEAAFESALPVAEGSGAIGGKLLVKNVDRLKQALAQIKLDAPDPL